MEKGGTLVKMQAVNIRFDLRLCGVISLLHGADFIFGKFSQFENISDYIMIFIEEWALSCFPLYERLDFFVIIHSRSLTCIMVICGSWINELELKL